MNLMDLLSDAGADGGLGQIAKQIGLSGSQAGDLVKALSPALTRGLQKQNASGDGMAAFARALSKGSHQQYVDQPEVLADEQSRLDGNKILGHLFGSKDVSRNVAAHASQQTGLSASMIKKALPLLASLVMGAVSKKSNAGKSLSDAPSGGLGGLGGLAGVLFGGGDKDDDGMGIDDVINLARKFF